MNGAPRDPRRRRFTSPTILGGLACALLLLVGALAEMRPAPAQTRSEPLDRPDSGATRPKQTAPKSTQQPIVIPQEKPEERAQDRKPAERGKAAERKEAPVAQPGEGAQAPQFQALAHARQAGIAACTDSLTRLLPLVVDAPHDAFSFWSAQNADDHLFGSIAALSYRQPVAPRGAAVVFVTPAKSGKCEGGGVQIVPTARSCGAVQAALMNAGRAVANLEGLPLVENTAGIRYLLAPTAGNGCVIVAVGVLSPK